MASANSLATSNVRYTVQSSDVLEDMRVNVCREGTQLVVWYKERFLADDEIIEHFVENATSTIHWTIHRPKRGWYIRLRSPAFPPGVFVSLTALPPSSPYHSEAALTFACRTSTSLPSHSLLSPSQSPPTRFVQPSALASSSTQSIDSETTLADSHNQRDRDSVTVHSYPPTPPHQALSPRSNPQQFSADPNAVEARLRQLPQASSPPIPSQSLSPTTRFRPQSQLITSPQITHFLLTPHLTVTPQEKEQAGSVSIFTRIAAALKSHAPARTSSSFTLSPVPSPSAAPLPSTPSTIIPTSTTPMTSSEDSVTSTALKPLLTFHDTTPVWTVRSTSGVLEVDDKGVRALGVEMSFWVAVALTYGEFLAEREGYLAAAAD